MLTTCCWSKIRVFVSAVKRRVPVNFGARVITLPSRVDDAVAAKQLLLGFVQPGRKLPPPKKILLDYSGRKLDRIPMFYCVVPAI